MTTEAFTRQQLYNRVWQEPVDRVAKELGISNVGLAKLCRRHNIPAPPRGAWARKAAGYAVKHAPARVEDLAFAIHINNCDHPQAPNSG